MCTEWFLVQKFLMRKDVVQDSLGCAVQRHVPGPGRAIVILSVVETEVQVEGLRQAALLVGNKKRRRDELKKARFWIWVPDEGRQNGCSCKSNIEVPTLGAFLA